jgi:hypothetical protein
MKTNFFSPGILTPNRGMGTRSIFAGALLVAAALLFAKGVAIGALFQIVGIGSGDNDHLQDGNFLTYAQLPATELGNFPGMMA